MPPRQNISPFARFAKVSGFRLIVAAGTLAGQAPAQRPVVPEGVEAFQPPAAALDADVILDRLAHILPGRFDNQAQLALAGPGETAYRLTTIITPVDVPALGGKLYHVEEFRDGNPAALARTRLYKFSKEGAAIVLHVLNPIHVEALRGIGADPARIAGLTPADITPDRASCALKVTAYGNSLVARMATHACRVGDLWIDYEMSISEDVQLTCHARRAQDDDHLEWLQMPAFHCIRQVRVRSGTQ